MRPNVQLKYGPMKKYKGNYRLWGESRTLARALPAKLNDNGCKRTASQCKTEASQPETKVQESKTPKQHFGTEPECMSIF